MAGSILGNNVRRVEDPRFITGRGRYMEDLEAVNGLYLRSVRSQIPHGILNEVHVAEARELPGIVAVLTADDFDLPDNRPTRPADIATGRPLVARDRVRFVGETVAVIVAESQVAAADAADLVWADIDPLDACASVEQALAATDYLYPELGTNIVAEKGDVPDPDFFADADVVVEAVFHNQRLAAVPMETSNALALSESDGSVTAWVSSQNVFGQRNTIAKALGLEPSEVRGRVADMGGGFGAKFYSYPEQIIAADLARRFNRPVRWIESRAENMVGMTHGRAQTQRVTIGAKADGKITGLRVDLDQEVGAYPTFAVYIPTWTRQMASGVYKIPKIEFHYRDIVSNTTPVHAYRGAGRPEASALVERIVDLLADRLEVDPTELRRVNFIQPEDFPFETATGAHYDSGDYEKALDKALEMADYSGLRAEQERRRAAGNGKLLGIGVASYVEVTAPADQEEWGAAEVHEDGTVTVRVGTSSHGQGHETAFAQVAAAEFKIPYTDITVIFGDTKVIERGDGTGGSRSLQIGGGAVRQASQMVVVRAKHIAADHLEASVDDIVVFDGGLVGVRGVPDSGLTWPQLVQMSQEEVHMSDADEGGGLAEETIFQQQAATYPFGTHVSVVEVDADTGAVAMLRHVAVDDAGNILNRYLMDGQVHGGIAQGAGQALLEEFQYDDWANPLTGNLVSYLIPASVNMPSFEIAHTETPTPHNEMGVKGIGEAATIGSTPAIHNAVIDAVSHLGVDHIDMPLTSAKVWEAINR
ncbi:MAG: xanthine dehydrogenase family protein [bacterium]|nr:xanthine dehydrogenase family protein [bacterium]